MWHERETSQMTSSVQRVPQGADLFFQAAIRYGYRYVFGNPGTTEAPFMDALARYPELQFLLFLQENGAAGAADGLARLTGWPAIVNVHLGPGLTNALSNIHNAHRAQVPLLVTVGDHHPRHLLEDSPLASDIERLARVTCKWTWTVKEAGEMADALYRATIIALTPPQGPVCLILPSNTLTATPRTVDGRIPEIPHLHLPSIGAAPRQDVEEAMSIFLKAHHPTILVGECNPGIYQQIVHLATANNAQIIYDWSPRRLDGDVLSACRELPYMPEERRAFLAQTDALFLVGVNSFTTLFLYENDAAPILKAGTQVIHLTDDLNALGKNLRGSFPLFGDIVTTLNQCVAFVADQKHDNQQREQTSNETALADNGAQHKQSRRDESDAGAIHVIEVAQALYQCLPRGTILVDESITARRTLFTHLFKEQTPVTSYLGVRGSAIGGGIPVALGAQLGAPDQQVVVVCGDGSAMYTIQILWTAARYHIPLLIVIFNNASYHIIKQEILRLEGTLADQSPELLNAFVNLSEPRLDFAQMAGGLGVSGQSVREHKALLPALKAALETCENGKPALIDVHVNSQTDFQLDKR